MEQRSVQIMDMYRIFHWLESKIICLAVDLPGFEPAPGEPHREGIDMVIPSRILANLSHWGSTELTSPNHYGLIQ